MTTIQDKNMNEFGKVYIRTYSEGENRWLWP